MKKYLVLALCTALSISFFSCGKKKEAPKIGDTAALGDIVEIASADGRLTTFMTAVNAAGLAETLKGEGPFTVFAPIDSAFAKLPPGTIESLLQEVPTLKNVLLLHVVPGKFTAADVANMNAVVTASGYPVPVMPMPGGKVMIGGANVVIADIPAKNGVIHVIDRVLLPPTPSD
jgi:uncharacterized surface protein with fasciclin (FAS1) repeats